MSGALSIHFKSSEIKYSRYAPDRSGENAVHDYCEMKPTKVIYDRARPLAPRSDFHLPNLSQNDTRRSTKRL